MKPKILYISYNGMMEALGASQVLSYLYQMSDEYEFHLVTLEKKFKDTEELERLKHKLLINGIYYYPIPYHQDKFRKPFNFIQLLRKANQIVSKEKINFVHCRAYFPALIALLLQKKHSIKYLFDTRGFNFDERADVGLISRDGFIYKNLKKLEKKLYNSAIGINMLSYEGKRVLEENELYDGSNKLSPITVIPTCVDLNRFKFNEKDFLSPLTIGYVGNAIGWYDFDKTLKVIKEIGKVMDYRFLIFNGNQHEFIKTKLREHNIPLEKVAIEKVNFSDMPEKLKAVDISVFYIRPLFSKKASAATKLGELLAAGIPVITNNKVGDHEFYIKENKTGLILDTDNLDQYNFKELIPQIANKETSLQCRRIAEQFFSAEKGAQDYMRLYKQLFV